MFEALEVKKELAADGIDNGAVTTKGETSAGADQACFKERVVEPGDGSHRDDGVADGGGGNIFIAKRAQGPKLAEILKRVGLLRGEDTGSFPTLKLAGTDLKDSQNIGAAIAGHSSMLPWVSQRRVRDSTGARGRIFDSGPGLSRGTGTKDPLMQRLCQG